MTRTGAGTEMHSYTLEDVQHLARYVIKADRWHRAGDVDERFDAVWFALVEHLCLAEEHPTWQDLVRVGMVASDRHVRQEIHHHGYEWSDRWRGTGGSATFQRYWWCAAQYAPSPEHRVIERVALTQIWPRLTRREQQAFTLLAATGSYEAAARALDIDTESLRLRIRAGRRHFLARWHDWETPSKPWRAGRHEPVRPAVYRSRNRLTVSQVEKLRDRYEAGERLRHLAAEVGVAAQTLSQLLLGQRRPAPDPELS